MGRYYDGDIEGKFWFGVQPSNDGEFFGCVEQEPTDINYYTEVKKNLINFLKKTKDTMTKCWIKRVFLKKK